MDRNRAVPIACSISQLHRVLNLCSWLPHMQAIPSRVLYARDSVLSARTLPWIGIAQCQSPARFLSCVVYRTSARAIYLPTSYAGQYPHERYTPVIPLFSLGLYLGSKLRSANRLPDFSAALCTNLLLVLSTWLPHMQAIPS